ncbi:DUF448 domain-containing protein [Deinococcus piscis]|uniref:DUF448 domain-containing protein n=1 Tax=Deinococcus piscis TaxID=394230 RepID=UPI001E399D64|nr:DUF448 domain-containing protein [Deinococcus piscis]
MTRRSETPKASAAAPHVPLRTCVACRCTRPQAELLRLTQTSAGGWHLAQPGTRRLPGRGRYLCAENPACWTEKKLRRAFGAAAPALAEQLAASSTEPLSPPTPSTALP